MRAQPVVAEDDIRVAVHVELHEPRLLVKAAEQQLCHRGAARLAQRAVRLAAGIHRHEIGSCAASSRLKKQCDAPESKKHLTRVAQQE